MRRVLTCLLLLLAGCSTPTRHEQPAESLGYEQGYRQAVKEQYWIIQRQQRSKP